MRDVDDDQILDYSVDLFELISGLGTEAKVGNSHNRRDFPWVFSRLEGYANLIVLTFLLQYVNMLKKRD